MPSLIVYTTWLLYVIVLLVLLGGNREGATKEHVGTHDVLCVRVQANQWSA
jgi:hypothetical protein